MTTCWKRAKIMMAGEVVTGMRIAPSVYYPCDTLRVSRVRFTSAGTRVIVEFADGSTRYYRHSAHVAVVQ